MAPRRHYGGRFRGGRRFGGPSTVVYEVPVPVAYEEAVFLDRPDNLDVLFVPPTDDPEPKIPQAGMTYFENDGDDDFLSVPRAREAGDLFPTFVTPEDAKRYMNEIDTGYSQLDAAIQSFAATPLDFKAAWVLQLGSWKAFFASAMPSVGWLNTKAVMDQTDRFASQLAEWRKSFATVGGNPPGPPPTPPGQGVPGSGNPTTDIVKVVAAVGAVAALVIFGPVLARSFSH